MAIELKDVSTKKLTNLNLSFQEGEITSIIGDCNSNKKELINLISNIEKDFSGNINYNVNNLNNNLFYLKEIVEDYLFNISIEEDLRYYLGEYEENKLNELLKSFELKENILKMNYLELSSSEVKKIILIIAIMIEDKILILDNLTLNLDSKAKQTLIKYLKRLKRENKIIIISSNDSNFLLEVSDKVIVIGDDILEVGDKYNIFSNEQLLKNINIKMPNIIEIIKKVKKEKNIKLNNRDNINDLIKDIYRNAK